MAQSLISASVPLQHAGMRVQSYGAYPDNLPPAKVSSPLLRCDRSSTAKGPRAP